MRTYKFKTLRGLYRAASGQLTAEALFMGRKDHPRRANITFVGRLVCYHWKTYFELLRLE